MHFPISRPVRKLFAMWAATLVWLFCPEIKTVQGQLFLRVWYRWVWLHIP